MRRTHFFWIASALLVSAAVRAEPPAPAAPLESNQPPAKSKAANDPNTVVCKNIVATGSRLGASKTCMTRQQWADIARSSGDFTAQRQINSARNGPVGGP